MNIENLPDLSEWNSLETWTLDEAAMLWGEIDPSLHTNKAVVQLKNYVSDAQYSKSMLCLRAAKEAICTGSLPFKEAWENFYDEIDEWHIEKIDNSCLPRIEYINTEKTRVLSSDFIKWANSKKIYKLSQAILNLRSEANEENIKIDPSNKNSFYEDQSPFDKSHPCYSDELRLAIEAWQIAVKTGAPKKGKSVKTTIMDIIETNSQFDNLSKDAKNRICVVANWAKKGGAIPTP